ncbi:hypothetical protein PILCRDRAFT_510889 [Piloderma croceum F 1598]|uniref:Amino acid permease/ SLC12A domain-containing protein n=1 Tax=Piloderma croceum (strain F 1598) TaxID=765440 RepID=A0A0C3FP71_PILCF|nr:hypothetical protein PILCRDRAFT_510889 [Piloderma croceum F 1598]
MEKKTDTTTSENGDPRSVEDGTTFHQADLDRVQRKLSRSHVQMIAIAGMVGTGLFLGLGQTLAVTGPLGVLLVYLHVATVIYATLTSIAEMTAFAPISGSFPHYAARWVDPALGFAVGWNYFYNVVITVPTEITAAAVLISFWDPDRSHIGIYVAVMCVLTIAVNLIGVRFFGNSEIFFSTLKVMLMIGLIIGGLVVTSGGGPDHQSHGFEYWRNPGPMVSYLEPGARGRFVGYLTAIIPAVFSMGGTEVIAIAAAETVNPRRNIATAMRTVFFRIVFFYILSVIVVGLLIPSNDPRIFRRASTAGQSPFVLAFSRAGIRALPSVINAAILTSAFSAGSSILFGSSRVLYGLAVRRQAPKVFSKCTASGLPYVAIMVSGAFSTLAFLNVSDKSGKVFGWLVNLATAGSLLGFATMNLTYLRFYYGLRAQGIKPEGIYHSPLQPYAAMWGLFWDIFFVLVSGISVFWSFNASDFIAGCMKASSHFIYNSLADGDSMSDINLPLFALLYVGYKIVKRTKVMPLRDLDFTTGIPSLEETEDAHDYTEPQQRTTVEKLKAIVQ